MHNAQRVGMEFPILIVQSVSKVYEMGDCQVHALKNTSIAVRGGEMLAIMCFIHELAGQCHPSLQ